MRRAGPPACRRRGCDSVRERWKLVCDECWSDVPWAARNRYVRARKAKLTRIAGEIGREIVRVLGRKLREPRTAPAATPTPTAAYARNCALLGEHDEIEPAE
jgi:hypothetical protein